MGTLSELVKQALSRRDAVLMAVVNTTPDSFSDGGQFSDHDDAKRHIDLLLQQGAALIDIGAESTRPGAQPVSAQEQVDRAAPAITHAVQAGACVSIDSTNPQVVREALGLGAKIVNDVSCLADPALAEAARDADADLIVMHSRGSMTKMNGFSDYDPLGYADIITEVKTEWKAAEERAISAGLDQSRIWFDPGLGFHKNAEHSSEIMRRLEEFAELGVGTVLGASRKSFIGALDGSSAQGRLGGSIAACLRGLEVGVSVLRVHDVHESKQAMTARRAWLKSPQLDSFEGSGGAHV